MFRASAMDLMLVRLRNGISIILLKSTFLGLGPTLVGFCEDTSKALHYSSCTPPPAL
ncbi:hypothetical protein MKW92_035240, partial [Papaver armeniacum]